MPSTLSRERLAKLAVLKRTDPQAWREIVDLVFEVERRDQRQEYEQSFLAFVRAAWSSIDAAPLSLAWFHEVIIENLEAVCRGEIRHLIINQPPRTSKTSLVSILYPAWCWARTEIGPQSGPQVKFFCVSYSALLAEEIAVKMRRLVQGAWYTGLWGDRVRISSDQQSRANFTTTAGGERVSTSIEAGLLGRGGDCQLLDDLHSTAGAESDLDRERTLRAFSEGLMTRITNPQTSAKVMVCQRLHLEDVTNAALEGVWPNDTTHIFFPARFEPDRYCPQDKRQVPGELLWEAVWNEPSLRAVELGLAGLEKGEPGISSYAASAQLQQNPLPRKGGVVQRTDWATWPEAPPKPEDIKRGRNGEFLVELPPVHFVFLSIDTAYSERESADYSACVTLGCWSRRRELVSRAPPWYSGRWGQTVDLDEEAARIEEGGEQPRIVVMESWVTKARLNDMTPDPRTGKPIGLIPRIIDTARRRKADRIVIEAKTRGKDVHDELVRQASHYQFLVEDFDPGAHGDKLARLHSTTPLFAAGLVYLPANLVRVVDAAGREQVEVREFQWANEIMNQCERCPRGKQDLADCISQGLIWLRTHGFLQLQPEFIQSELDRRAYRPPAFNAARHYGVLG
jgi:phage terminase large subunit-like protein